MQFTLQRPGNCHFGQSGRFLAKHFSVNRIPTDGGTGFSVICHPTFEIMFKCKYQVTHKAGLSLSVQTFKSPNLPCLNHFKTIFVCFQPKDTYSEVKDMGGQVLSTGAISLQCHIFIIYFGFIFFFIQGSVLHFNTVPPFISFRA